MTIHVSISDPQGRTVADGEFPPDLLLQMAAGGFVSVHLDSVDNPTFAYRVDFALAEE